MNPRDLMRKAHLAGSNQGKATSPAILKEIKIKEEVEKELVEKAKVEEEVVDLPTGVLRVKRDDVSSSEYGLKPDITNFQLYNYELSEFLTSFSKNNKKNGGAAITKSQLMEIVLGFAFYDLKLEPKGYHSVQDLLEDLKKKVQ